MPTRSTKRGQLLSRPCLSATAQRTSTPMRSRWSFWCPTGVRSIMSNVRSSSFAVVAAAALVGMLVGSQEQSSSEGTTQRPLADDISSTAAARQYRRFADRRSVSGFQWACAGLSSAIGCNESAAQTKNMLIFTTFRPATFMGKPTSGTVTLIFSQLNTAATSTPSNTVANQLALFDTKRSKGLFQFR
jgi:hypothetical protein